MHLSRPRLIVLLILNCIVLLGQLWPEGAPPIARIVNIILLLASLVVCAILAFHERPVKSTRP